MAYGFRETKEILIRKMTSIEYKDAGSVLNGHILFLYRGGRDVKTSVFGENSVTSNENAVIFDRDNQAAFDTLRRMLDDKMNQYNSSQQAVMQTGPSYLDELKKLAELRDAGIITSDEFYNPRTYRKSVRKQKGGPLRDLLSF